MIDCWELNPKLFQVQLEEDPHYIPNRRQIELLRDSQGYFNLDYLYQRQLINWSEFVWNLALSEDSEAKEALGEISQNRLNQINLQSSDQDLRDAHIMVSAILSVTDNEQLASSILKHPKLNLLVENQGLFTPVLVLESSFLDSAQSLFRPLDWDFLESPSSASYLVKISGKKLNLRSVESLVQLANEEPQNFNQLFSQYLMTTTLSQRKILDNSELVNHLFTFLFYDRPWYYSLTPLLQHLNYLNRLELFTPQDLVDLIVSLYQNQSVEQKELMGELLLSLIEGGVNQRTYPMALFLNLIKFNYHRNAKLGRANRIRNNWISRLINLIPDTDFNRHWLKLYFNLTYQSHSPQLDSDQEKNLRESLIETLVVNEDSSVFKIYKYIPLQYLLKALILSRTNSFSRKIIQNSPFTLDILPTEKAKYPVQIEFYDDPCQLKSYEPYVANVIFKIFVRLGLIQDDNPLFQQLRKKILDQDRLQLMDVSSDEVFEPKQYHLNWLKSTVKYDQANALRVLETYLRNHQFELTTSTNDPDNWTIKDSQDRRQLRQKLRTTAEQLSSQLVEINPYVANQIGILATDFSTEELLLLYRSLPLPYRPEYLNYDRDRLALVTINDLRSRIRDFPEEQWVVAKTLSQALDFVNYTNVRQLDRYDRPEQLEEAYSNWLEHYTETHRQDEIMDVETFQREEIIFDPRDRQLVGQISSLRILEPFHLTYSPIKNDFTNLDALTKTIKDSSVAQFSQFLKQVNLIELLIILLDQSKYGLLYEIVARINQDDYLRQRLKDSALYLLVGLIKYPHIREYLLGQLDNQKHKTKYSLWLAFYYVADQTHTIEQVAEMYMSLADHFQQPLSFNPTTLSDLLEKLVMGTSLASRGSDRNLSLPSDLAFLDSSLFITSENLRLAGLMDRTDFKPIELNQLTEKKKKIDYDHSLYRRALLLLSRASLPTDPQYFPSVFNLTDFGDLAQTVPIFFNLIDHGQTQALEALIARIPESVRDQFIDQAQQSFNYHYEFSDINEIYRKVETKLPFEGCPSDETQIRLNSLILVPRLSSVLKVLIRNYQFDSTKLIPHTFGIFQNMIYHKDWDILAIYQELGLDQMQFDLDETYINLLVDIIMMLGQVSDLDEIERYYEIKASRASLNPIVLEAIDPKRFPVIYEVFNRLEMNLQKNDDFWLIALAELNSEREIAQWLRDQYQRTNTRQVLLMISCMINRGLPTGRNFYDQYKKYLDNYTDPNLFLYLFRAILFSGRTDDLINLATIFGYNDTSLQQFFGDHYLRKILISLKIIVTDLETGAVPSEFNERKTELDRNLSQMIEVLVRDWKLERSVVQQNRFLILLAFSGFIQTLLTLDRFFNLSLENLTKDDELYFIYFLGDPDFLKTMEVLVDYYNLRLSNQTKEELFNDALIEEYDQALKFIHDKLDFKLADLEMEKDRLFSLIGSKPIEVFKIMRDTYGLNLDPENQSLLVEKIAINNNSELLVALPSMVELDLNYIRRQANDMFAYFSGVSDSSFIEVLRILRDTYGFRAENLQTYAKNPIIVAAIENKPGRLKEYQEVFNLTAEDARANNNEALREAAKRRHVEVLRVLHDDYGLGAEDARANNNEVLRGAANRRHVEVLRVLHDDYGLGAEDARANNNEALFHAAALGYLEVLQILHDLYGLGAEDAQTEDNRAIRRASNNGLVEILKILYDLYGLRAEDAQARDNEALREAASYGYAEVLQILHDLYGLGKEDAQARDNEALIMAAGNGHAEVLRVLHDLYGLGKEDAQARDNEALIKAADNGHAEVLRVLHDFYGLDKKDAQTRDNEALIKASGRGYTEVIRVLHDDYSLTVEDIKAQGYMTVIRAIKFSRTEILQLFYDLYGLRIEDLVNNKEILTAIRRSMPEVTNLMVNYYGLTAEYYYQGEE